MEAQQEGVVRLVRQGLMLEHYEAPETLAQQGKHLYQMLRHKDQDVRLATLGIARTRPQ